MWGNIKEITGLFLCSCHCEMYISAEELCNSSCLSALPVLSARLAPNGQLVLKIKMMEENRMWSRVSAVCIYVCFFFLPKSANLLMPFDSRNCFCPHCKINS